MGKALATPVCFLVAALLLVGAVITHAYAPADQQPKAQPAKMISQPLPKRVDGPSAPKEATVTGQFHSVSYDRNVSFEVSRGGIAVPSAEYREARRLAVYPVSYAASSPQPVVVYYYQVQAPPKFRPIRAAGRFLFGRRCH